MRRITTNPQDLVKLTCVAFNNDGQDGLSKISPDFKGLCIGYETTEWYEGPQHILKALELKGYPGYAIKELQLRIKYPYEVQVPQPGGGFITEIYYGYDFISFRFDAKKSSYRRNFNFENVDGSLYTVYYVFGQDGALIEFNSPREPIEPEGNTEMNELLFTQEQSHEANFANEVVAFAKLELITSDIEI